MKKKSNKLKNKLKNLLSKNCPSKKNKNNSNYLI